MEKVNKYLERIVDLPVLPEIANRVISIADSPDPDITELATLIEKDPAITAKILKLINSGYYALRTEVTSVRQAVLLLGIKPVRNLVVTMVTLNHFEEPAHAKINLSDFWNHSLGVATIAQKLAEKFGYKETGDLYLAALLHDIGKLIVQAYFPILMARIIKDIDQNACSMYEAELAVLGLTHSQLGAAVAKKWNFPKRIVNAIEFHHDCENAEDPIFTATLQLSDLLTKARLFAVYGDQNFDVIFEDEPCWRVLEKAYMDQDLDLARLLFEMEDEIDKARELVTQARRK